MHQEPLPAAAADSPIIQTLICLHIADEAMNRASVAIRCALLPELIGSLQKPNTLAGLDSLMAQFQMLHATINGALDQLEFLVEVTNPIPDPSPST